MEDVTKDWFLLLWVLGMNSALWECQANTLPLSYILDRCLLLVLTQNKQRGIWNLAINTTLLEERILLPCLLKLEIGRMFYIKTLPLLFRGEEVYLRDRLTMENLVEFRCNRSHTPDRYKHEAWMGCVTSPMAPVFLHLTLTKCPASCLPP